jgi:glutamate carboxypeptidase
MPSVEQMYAFLEGRREAFLEDLRTLVSIDSGSFDKSGVDEVNDWLLDRLLALGFSVQRLAQETFGDDLLATLDGLGRQHVLLLGHTDTVFPTGTASERPSRSGTITSLARERAT